MMIRVLPLIGLGLAMSACRPVPASISAAQCPAWENIDLRSLPTHLNNDPSDPRLEDLLTTWRGGQSSVQWKTKSPTATLYFRTIPGMTSNPIEREVAGRRSADEWEFYARSRTIPEKPFGSWEPWTPWKPVRLPRSTEQKLMAIMEDPCLWAAPRFIGDDVRLLNGHYASSPDRPSTSYDITYKGRRWSGWQMSWTLGPPGQLQQILMSDAFGLPEGKLDQIDAYGWPK